MRDSGKILVVSQFYAPDFSTTAAYISAIAEALAADSRVVVLSGSGNSGVEARGDGKPEVVEVRSWMPQKDALIRRSIAITLLALKMFFSTLKRARRGDVVFCVTTPFTAPYAVVLAAKLRGAATILLVYDLYPEALEKTGLITPSSLTARLIRLANTRLFRSLDAIITIGRDVEPLLLVYREVTSAKINLIPNWTLLPVAYRELSSDNRFRAGHNSKLVVGLSGELADFLSAADVWVIPYLRNIAGVSIPSRLYNHLAVGRAIIVAAEPHSEASLVVNEDQIGWVVPPEDPRALADAIVLAASDRAATAQMGRRAAVAAEKYGPDSALKRYRELIQRVRQSAHRTE